MFFIILGAFVVVLLVGAWLLQRRFPGRINLSATQETRDVLDRAQDEHARTRMRNPNGPGGFGAP